MAVDIDINIRRTRVLLPVTHVHDSICANLSGENTSADVKHFFILV